MVKLKYFLPFLFLTFIFTGISCTKEGCTDPKAVNYDKTAVKDNGFCIYKGTINLFLEKDCNCDGVDFWVDNKYTVRMKEFHPSEGAECGDGRGLSLKIPEGVHKIRAMTTGSPTGEKSWEAEVVVKGRICQKITVILK